MRLSVGRQYFYLSLVLFIIWHYLGLPCLLHNTCGSTETNQLLVYPMPGAIVTKGAKTLACPPGDTSTRGELDSLLAFSPAAALLGALQGHKQLREELHQPKQRKHDNKQIIAKSGGKNSVLIRKSAQLSFLYLDEMANAQRRKTTRHPNCSLHFPVSS